MADFGEDSDDSDGEGGLGNVNRLIMRPPGHSGKAKKGHLCFDASFETGNLGRVDLVNEYEYDLFVRPDTCSPRLRFWFNFTVDNVKQDQRVIFNVVNLGKERNLFMEGMTPLVKSSSRPKWQRIPKKHVFYHKSPVHQGHYVLSFAFGFDKEDDVFQFALAPPYSYSKLQTFLSILEKKAAYLNDNFARELIANSVQKRRVDVLTVGSLDKSKPKCKRRVVAIMARVHPGDSPASYVCQGLLELLVSSNSVAAVLREHVIFKVIPMLNPDGTFLGNYRSTVMGIDLNRSWQAANCWSHPTTSAATEMLTTLDKNKTETDICLDGQPMKSFCSTREFRDAYVLWRPHGLLKTKDVRGRPQFVVELCRGVACTLLAKYERHILFPKLLATTCDDYVAENTMFNSDSNKIGTARRFLCQLLSDRVNCYTFEVSIFGYKLKGLETTLPYTEESYMRCGRNLVRAFLEYYHNIGAIPLQIASEVPTKQRRAKTGQVRRRNRNRYDCRSKTSRTQALIHFQNLNINYDSETSAEDNSYSYRNTGSTRRTLERLHERYHSRKAAKIPKNDRIGSPEPPTFVVLPEPSLTIVDFNVISRDDLDRVALFNKGNKVYRFVLFKF